MCSSPRAPVRGCWAGSQLHGLVGHNVAEAPTEVGLGSRAEAVLALYLLLHPVSSETNSDTLCSTSLSSLFIGISVDESVCGLCP